MRFSLSFALLGLAAVAAADDRVPERFRGLREAVRPTADEDKWATIPWGVSLWEARQRAAKEGKPILLWEMDGHPLGCT